MFMGILQDLWDLVETLTLNLTYLHGSVMMASELSSSNVTTSPLALKRNDSDGLSFRKLQGQNHG